MMKLNRRIKRNIRSNLSFYIITSILTMMTCVLIIGAASTGETMSNNFQEFFDHNKVESAQIYTKEMIPDEEIAQLENQYNLRMEEQKYYDHTNSEYTLRVYAPSEKINTYQITKGSELDSDDEILISERFANAHGLSIGEEIDVGNRSFKIVGFMVRPDYMYMLKNLTDSYYNYDNFGLAVIGESALQSMGTYVSYYSVLYHEENELSFRNDLNNKYTVRNYLASTANTRIEYPSNQGRDISQMAMNFAPVLFIMVMAVTALILSRKIKSEQKLLGTLSALGYKPSELTRHYMVYAAIPAVAGSILGVAAGWYLVEPFSNFYFNDFEIILHTVTVNPGAVLISIVIPLVLYELVAFIVVIRLLRKNAAHLLRTHISIKSYRVKRVFRKQSLSFRTKFRLRLLLGHLPRTAVALFGMVCAGGCILTGFAMSDSTNKAVISAISKTPYEYTYALNTPVTEIPKNAEGALCMNFEAPDSSFLFKLCGIDESTKYLELKTLSGKEIDYGKYYMTNAAAKTYGVQPGDRFTFYNIITAQKHSLIITDIVEGNANLCIYTSRKNAADLTGYPSEASNLLVSNEKLSLDPDIVLEEKSKTALKESVDSLINSARGVVCFIIVIGFFLGTMVIYLITNMIINENKINISMLKVLGYKQAEINKLVLNVNHIILILGYILSIPVTMGICTLGFADSAGSMGIFIPAYISGKSYAIALLIIILSYGTSLMLLRRKTLKINMVESLKDNRE